MATLSLPIARADRSTLRSRRCRVFASKETELCRDKVALPKRVEQAEGTTFTATFLGKDGQRTSCTIPADGYILEEAEAQGLDLPCTCRGGICGACVGRIVEGTVDMSDIPDLTFTLSEEEIADGMALLCMSRPTSDVVIETQCDWGYSLGVAEWKGASGTQSATPEPLMGDKWQPSDT